MHPTLLLAIVTVGCLSCAACSRPSNTVKTPESKAQAVHSPHPQSLEDMEAAEIERLKSIEGTTTWHGWPEGTPPTEEYLTFFERLKSHIAKYQPTAEWHRQLRDDIGTTGWTYDAKEADRVLGFIQNQPIHSITHGTYQTQKGEIGWFCKIRFHGRPDALFPPILDVYIVKTPDGFRVNGLNQDHC